MGSRLILFILGLSVLTTTATAQTLPASAPSPESAPAGDSLKPVEQPAPHRTVEERSVSKTAQSTREEAEQSKVQPEKSQPMLGSKQGVWGQIGLSYRLRPELRDNSDLDNSVDDTTLVGWQRARINGALNYRGWVKAFVQLQDARTLGYGNSSVAYTGNTDLHQAWAQLSAEQLNLSVKIGRQQLVYGDQRLIGHLEWANQGRVFEGAVARWQHPLGQLDGFATVFTPQQNGTMLDATYFVGLYDTLTFLDSMLVWEQYFLALVDNRAAMAPGTTFDPALETQPASPNRKFVTLGSRLRFDAFGVTAGVEAAYQLGSANATERIGQNAFALHADAKYTIPIITSPFVAIEGNYGSGDNSATDSQSERFINLFPTNHMHYGYMDLQSWSNAANASIKTGLSLGKSLHLGLDYWLLARASGNDDWYSAGGKSLLQDATASGEHKDSALLGHEVDATVKFVPAKQVKIITGASLFVPTGFASIKGTDPQLWAYSMLIVSL